MQLSYNLDASRYTWGRQVVERLLARAPSSDVFDVGAGAGEMRGAVEGAGGRWHGFDLVPALEGVRRWDVDEPGPTNAKAGIVLLLDVVEHLGNPWRGMHNVGNVLAPGGFVVITTPNPRWSRSRMACLATGLPTCFAESDTALNHHVFTPWPHILEKLLTDVGLEVEEYVTLDGKTAWPGPPFAVRYPARLALAVVNKLIERADPTACGMSYGVVARKP